MTDTENNDESDIQKQSDEYEESDENPDGESYKKSNVPLLSRRGALLSGAWLGGFGLLNGTQSAVATPGGGGNGSGGSRNNAGGVERSSLRTSLERKIEQADGDETLQLQIHTEPERLDDAVEAVVDAGGDVRTSYATLILADVPVGRIREIASSNSIRLAGEYIQPEVSNDIRPKVRRGDLPDDVGVSDFEASSPETTSGHLPTSEGVEISRADELHEMGITGDGVTIAIFDTRFNIHNERYADQVVATLGPDEDHPAWETAYETPGGHGDGVTDIVAAMAPDADLVLGDTFVFPEFGFFDALEEVEADWPGVDVANYSVGHLVDFRIDGLDPISLRVAEFTDEIDGMFVNSAGNSAAVGNAWMWVEGVGAVPLPQERGDAYDSQGPGVFEDRGRALLKFDAHFEEDLEVSTRLPITTFEDVAVNTGHIGWVITHWDADPDVDDQIYAARLYRDAETNRPLATSRTRNPWETIDVLGEYFVDDVRVTMDVEDDAWVVTRVRGRPDVAPLDEPNPTLTLPEGQRYRFTNDAWREHPLEFRDAGGNPLLSQDPDTEGAFEDDDVVDWEDRGRWAEFTLPVSLAAALDHYVSTEDDDTGGTVATELPPPLYLEVQRVRADEDHHFDVWASFGGVDIPTPWATDARSLGIPALSRDDDLLATGAVQAVDLGPGEGETLLAFERHAEDLKGYSSQGPTQDGRRGLDIAGSAHVSTNARGPVEAVFGFNGTSAAAPHATGAVGLLFEVEDDTGAIRNALFEGGRGIADPDVGDPGEDNTQIGFGYLDVAAAFELLDVEVEAQPMLQ